MAEVRSTSPGPNNKTKVPAPTKPKKPARKKRGASRPAKATRRKRAEPRLHDVLRALFNSARGKIFICNLVSAAEEPQPLLDRPKLRALADLAVQWPKLLGREEELMGAVRYEALKSKERIGTQHAYEGIPEEFSKRQRLISVITVSDYTAYYAKTRDRIIGFDFVDPKTPPPRDWKGTYFDDTAKTLFPFWAAPTHALPHPPKWDDAEGIRDALGLVHRGKKKPLIAILFTPPEKHHCYRPTVLDAMPNARFMQRHPHMGKEDWGYTINLATLDAQVENELPADIKSLSGLPELVLDALNLRDCTDVEFVSLGLTETDRATESADRKFVEALEAGREAEEILRQLHAIVGQKRST